MSHKLISFIAFILFSICLYGRSLDVKIHLLNDEIKLGKLTKLKNNVPSRFSVVKIANEIISLNEIQYLEAEVDGENFYFKPLTVQVFEETKTILGLMISEDLYEATIKFRLCTCNNKYTTTRALIVYSENKNYVLLKAVFRNKILKEKGKFPEVPEFWLPHFRDLKFKYSSIRKFLINRK